MIAGEQHGCISIAQARTARLSHKSVQRRVETKRWKRVLPGVFVVSGSPETWEQRLFAAVLWLGEGAAVAGVSAAALWELPGFSPGRVEVAHPGSKQSRRGIVVHRSRLEPGEVTRIGILPVTVAARTLADLAGRIGERRLDVAVHHCLHHRLTTLPELHVILADRRGRRFAGSARLGRAIDNYDPSQRPAESPLEVAVARLLTASDLPAPVRQHEVAVRGRVRRLDFAWPEARVALEVDGYRWHSSRSSWENDRARLADLRRAGWTIIHVTQSDLGDPFAEVVSEVRRHL